MSTVTRAPWRNRWPLARSLSHLRRLSRIVATKRDSVHLVSSLVHQAIHDGELIETTDHAFVPARRRRGLTIPGLPSLWSDHGFEAFRIKRCTLPPAQIRALGVIFDVLNRDSDLLAVPQWISDGWVLSLYLADAVDLRSTNPDDHSDAEAVHEVCLRSLASFTERDEALREALRSAGCEEPERFPISDRYQRALRSLAKSIAVSGDLDLPDELPQWRENGRWTLFCDPKPANFLVASSQRASLCATTAAFRIDLDLLFYQCPLALQVVLALFAHPVALRSPEPMPDQVASLRAIAHTAGKAWNVDPDEIDAMLLYHLVRNFSTAATEWAAGKSAARGKALGMAPVLASALELLPVVDAPRTQGALRQWMRDADPMRR
jgi:hypothetical protein